MAAWLESPDHLVVDLRNISAADMAPLLDEETAAWRLALDWDFEPSAELVRRFVGMQALNGFALLEGWSLPNPAMLGPSSRADKIQLWPKRVERALQADLGILHLYSCLR